MRSIVLASLAFSALTATAASGQMDTTPKNEMARARMEMEKSQAEMDKMRSPGPSADARDYGIEVQNAYVKVRHATSPFRKLDAAVTAGYAASAPQCLAAAEHGAMGYHHVNREYLDNTLDVEKPEILLYERRSNGKYELNGVEYIVPYRVWPADSVPPKIMGRSLARADELKLWYMHMWVWKRNRAGLFANYNPDAECRTPPA